MKNALDVVRSAEMTEKHLQELESDSSVHGIGNEKNKSVLKKQLSDKEEKPPTKKMLNCRNCGTKHGVGECSAYGKMCQRQRHFQSMCRSRKKIHGLEEETKEHDCNTNRFVGAITNKVGIQNDECFVILQVQGHVTRLKQGAGSQVNILPVRELKKIIGSNPCMDPN